MGPQVQPQGENKLLDPAFVSPTPYPEQEGEEEGSLCLPVLLCSLAATEAGRVDALWLGENTKAV